MADDKPRKLPVFGTVKRVWLFLFRHQREFWRIVWFPAIVWPVAAIFILYFPIGEDPYSITTIITWGIALVILFVPALTTWHRFVIEGQFPRSLLLRMKFGKREIVFLLILVAGKLLDTIVQKTVDFAFLGTDSSGLSEWIALAVILFVFAVLLRFCLLLPEAAIGEEFSPARSWKLTQGNGTRLFFSLILSVITVNVFTGILYLGSSFLLRALRSLSYNIDFYSSYYVDPYDFVWLTWFIVAEGLFVATFLSLCYRHLTGREDEAEPDGGVEATADP